MEKTGKRDKVIFENSNNKCVWGICRGAPGVFCKSIFVIKDIFLMLTKNLQILIYNIW